MFRLCVSDCIMYDCIMSPTSPSGVQAQFIFVHECMNDALKHRAKNQQRLSHLSTYSQQDEDLYENGEPGHVMVM